MDRLEYLKNKVEKVKPLHYKYEPMLLTLAKKQRVDDPTAILWTAAFDEAESVFARVVDNDPHSLKSFAVQSNSRDPEYCFWFDLNLSFMVCRMFLYIVEGKGYETLDANDIEDAIMLWDKAEGLLKKMKRLVNKQEVKDVLVFLLAAGFLTFLFIRTC